MINEKDISTMQSALMCSIVTKERQIASAKGLGMSDALVRCYERDLEAYNDLSDRLLTYVIGPSTN